MDNNELKLGSVLSLAGVLLNILLGFFISPISLHYLGESTYGLYQLMWSLVGYTVVLDMGFSTTVIRYVAKYRALRDEEGEGKFIYLSMLFYAAVSAVVLVAGLVLYYNLANFFGRSLTAHELILGKRLFLIMLTNFLLSMLLNVFPGIVSGYERFIFQKGLVIVKQLFRTAVVVASFWLGGRSIALAFIDLFVLIGFLTIQVFYVFFRLKVRIKRYRLDLPYIKEIFSFSIFVFIMLVVDQLNWKTDHFIIGNMIDAKSVAVYSIALQFPLYYSSISFSITYNFLPRAMQLVSEERTPAELTDYMIKIARILWVVLGLALIGFGLFGRQFILLWVGESFADAYYIAFFIMCALTISLFQEGGTNLLQARKKHGFRSMVYLIIAVLNVVITVCLVPGYGIMGACVGTVLSYLVGNVLLMTVYYHKKAGFDMKRFFKEAARGNLPASAAAVLLGLFVNRIPVGGWTGLFIKGGLFCIIYVALFYQIALTHREKEQYLEMFKKLLRF